MCVYVYIYICVYVCVHTYMYTFVYKGILYILCISYIVYTYIYSICVINDLGMFQIWVLPKIKWTWNSIARGIL